MKLFFIQNLDEADCKALYEGESHEAALKTAISHTMMEDDEIEKTTKLSEKEYEFATTSSFFTVTEIQINNWM